MGHQSVGIGLFAYRVYLAAGGWVSDWLKRAAMVSVYSQFNILSLDHNWHARCLIGSLTPAVVLQRFGSNLKDLTSPGNLTELALFAALRSTALEQLPLRNFASDRSTFRYYLSLSCYSELVMSAEASRRLHLIEQLFVAAGSPDITAWYFYAGQTGADLEELASLGLVFKVLGTERGFAWRLSDAGMKQLHGSAP
jgi:hypothetical protein